MSQELSGHYLYWAKQWFKLSLHREAHDVEFCEQRMYLALLNWADEQ